MSPRIIAISPVLAAAILLSACGANNREERRVHGVSMESRYQQALMAQPVSDPFAPELSPAGAATCADVDSQGILQQRIDLRVENAGQFWSACQALFRCSPHAQEALVSFSASPRPFRVAFVEFNHLPGTAPLDRDLQGLYLNGTDRVFLQARTVSGGALIDSCSTLIHELHHFYNMGPGDRESLSLEFPAHYLENWFLAEVLNRESPTEGDQRSLLIPTLPGGRPVTRLGLASLIVSEYGLDTGTDEIQRTAAAYAPYPWEAGGNRLAFQ